MPSGCGACDNLYKSQKASKIRRNDGEVWRKSFKNLKFYGRVKEIYWPDWQKQPDNLGQSNSLLMMCILPLQHGQFVYFELVGPCITINCVPPMGQGCRLPHACMPVACWNDVERFWLTSSRAQLVCSYFIFRQSTAVWAGLYTSKSDTSKNLSSATFIFCWLRCLSQVQ